jgi:hypothetical protein
MFPFVVLSTWKCSGYDSIDDDEEEEREKIKQTMNAFVNNKRKRRANIKKNNNEDMSRLIKLKRCGNARASSYRYISAVPLATGNLCRTTADTNSLQRSLLVIIRLEYLMNVVNKPQR